MYTTSMAICDTSDVIFTQWIVYRTTFFFLFLLKHISDFRAKQIGVIIPLFLANVNVFSPKKV